MSAAACLITFVFFAAFDDSIGEQVDYTKSTFDGFCFNNLATCNAAGDIIAKRTERTFRKQASVMGALVDGRSWLCEVGSPPSLHTSTIRLGGNKANLAFLRALDMEERLILDMERES